MMHLGCRRRRVGSARMINRRLGSIASVAAAVMVMLSATTGSAQTAGIDPAAGTPLPGGVTVIDREHPVTSSGTLRLWRAFSSDGARVMLKVFRPDGDRLLLIGTSPLETVPAGTTVTFACSIPIARGDLVGCFCPDSSCVDGDAAGLTWTADRDVGTVPLSELAEAVGTPAVFAAGSILADVPSTAATELVLPVAARTRGANSTVWSTRLELMNPGDDPVQLSLLFNLSNADNTTPAASAQAEIGPGTVLTFPDLLLDAFNLADASGSVDIVATAPIFGHARIANDGGSSGSFGQSAPALPADWALASDPAPGADPAAGVAVLFGVRENGDFRSNLGIASTASTPLTVVISAAADGSPVGTPLQIELPPYSHHQINRILTELGVAPGTPGVLVRVAAAAGVTGRFFAYLSEIDNLSGDAVVVLGDRIPSLPAR